MTKEETNIVKGIAILCMLFHHLFGNAASYMSYDFTGLILNIDTTMIIAKDMKVCVAVYALLSGYGMTMQVGSSDAKDTAINIKWHIRNTVKRYYSLIKDTIFLIALAVPISVLFNLSRQPKVIWGGSVTCIMGILTNMTGLAGFFKIAWFIRSWWYLKLAILFILLFPLLYYLTKIKTGQLVIVVWYVFMIICIPDINPAHDNIWRYFPAFFLGMLMAKWGVIEYLSNLAKNNISQRAFISISSICLLGVLVFIKHSIGMMFITQAAQAMLICIFSTLTLSGIPVLSQGLMWLGKNSKYMWLIHVYIYGQLIKDLLFSLKNIWLIFTVLTILSFTVSIILKKVCDMLFNFRVKSFLN